MKGTRSQCSLKVSIIALEKFFTTRFMPSDDSSIFSREAMMFGAHRSTCFLMSSIAFGFQDTLVGFEWVVVGMLALWS